MLQIHFIDDSGQPLCSVPESDRWLWTVNRRSVTCSGCLAALAAQPATRTAPDTREDAAPAIEADSASGIG
jgi:hypothetical protein